MNKSLFKDFYKTILKNPSRFFSILLIISLGVGFFAGINATRPDMENSANSYYKNYNLSDIRSYNPLGYKNSEIEEVKKIENIKDIMPTFRKDVFINFKSEKATLRLMSLDMENYDTLQNKVVVKEGRLPKDEKEIVINQGKYNKVPLKIGDKINISLPQGENLNDYLKYSEFTIVGFIESPLYISYQRDRTNIGSGVIETYGYIGKNNFTMKEYNEIFITLKNTGDLSPTSEAYKKEVTKVKDKVTALGITHMSKETEELKRELNENKKKFIKEKDDATEKINDGKIELVLSRDKIENGEIDLDANLISTQNKLVWGENEILEKKKELLDGLATYNTNLATWNSGNTEYQNGKATLDASKTELDKAKATLDASASKLSSAYNELINGKTQLDFYANAINEMINLRNSLPQTIDPVTYNSLLTTLSLYYPEGYNYLVNNVNQNDPNSLSLVFLQIDSAITSVTNSYNSALSSYNSGLSQYESGKAQYEDGLAKYNSGYGEYLKGKEKLDSSKVTLDDGKKKLDDAKKTLDDGDLKLKQGELDLKKGALELDKGVLEGSNNLATYKESLLDGEDEYYIKRKDALNKIKEAEDKILKAERDILEIPNKWLVNSREGNPDYSSYYDNAIKIGNVAKVFPLFFFLVAALVSLTTITRMVEEERLQAGTLKALGYSSFSIATKYILYALSSSLIGSVIGLVIGFNLFPRVIMNAYNLMYSIPVSNIDFNLPLAILSTIIAVLSTVLSAIFAIINEIKETPANLMQGKAPAPGKRIFLEKVTPIWKRLSFSKKVTMRNLFLYKKRFLMTVIGIAGCTALVVTGFGIKDSVEAMVKNQFRELSIYNELVIFDTKKNPNIDEILKKNTNIKGYLKSLNESVDVKFKNSDKTISANMVVPENTSNIKDFQVLRDEKTKSILDFNDSGVIINEKLGYALNIKVGDEITYQDIDKNEFKVKVIAFCENYLENYIYMSPTLYKNTHKLIPKYNSSYLNLKDEALKDEDAINSDLLKNDGVLTILSAKKLGENFEEQISSLIVVVIVLILSAGLLAFIVLYNLSNVNITERKRELATIKVLGFKDNEVSAYVYRENMLLTLIGSIVGLFLGVYLHKFIMGTLEIENMMFGKKILPLSFMLAIGLTFIFSFIVNFIMHFELKKIDMVESLKSVE